MSRPARLAAVVAFVAAAGCGVSRQATPTRLTEDDVRVVAPTTSTSLPLGTRTRHVELCFISGDRLITLVTELPAPLSVAGALRALVDAPRTVLPGGARTAISEPNMTTARATKGGIAQVDLNRDFTQTPAADQRFAIGQVVCTLTSLPGIGQVHFTLEGRPVEIPRADGSLTNRAVSRADYQPLLPTS
jgi:spore germination protein GerM